MPPLSPTQASVAGSVEVVVVVVVGIELSRLSQRHPLPSDDKSRDEDEA